MVMNVVTRDANEGRPCVVRACGCAAVLCCDLLCDVTQVGRLHL